MIRGISKVLLIVIAVLNANGQSTNDPTCGTEVTVEQMDFMNSIHTKLSSGRSTRATNAFSPVRVPVKFFIIRTSANTGGLATSRISTLLDDVNNAYTSSGMTFFEVEEATIIANDDFYNLDSSQETDLAGPRDLGGVINIYVSGNLTSGSSALCGYTRFPPSSDRIFLAMSCADNEFGTTAHELGHYFTLYHTHGKTNTGTTDELVTRGAGANCTTAGDDICDTPADPNLSGQISGCSYTGTSTDGSGAAFNPNPRNIMSYAPNSCRDFFSEGQYERIRDGLDLGRNYLNLVFDNFTAKFDTDMRVGCAPVTVEFTDVTNNAVSRNWNLPGSDKENSPLKTVFVTYTEPGFYDVTLTVTNSEGQESVVTRKNYILVKDPFENVVQETTANTFETSDLPVKWSIENEDNGTSWVYDATSVDAGSGSYFLNNFDYGSEFFPQDDDLSLSSFDLLDLKSIQIDFSYAYTHKFFEADVSVNAYDALIVGYKLDCDNDIDVLWEKSGIELRTTASGRNDYFTPTNDEWDEVSITIDKADIPLYTNFSSFTPVIRNQSGNGNNMYIDNVRMIPDFTLDSLTFFRAKIEDEAISLRWANSAINSRSVMIEKSVNGADFEELAIIDPSITEYIDDSNDLSNFQSIEYRAKNLNNLGESTYSVIAEITAVLSSNSSENEIKIYPNPTTGSISVITSSVNTSHTIEVMDLSGRVVKRLVTSQNESQLNLSNLEGGLFFVRIDDGVNVTTKKIVKLD